VLNKYEYLTAFTEIDNIIGMIPVAMALIGMVGATVLLWIKHKKQFATVSIAAALLVILSVVLFPTALRGNWWINTATSGETEAMPDLTVYAPFSDNSKTAKLDQKSELHITDSILVLDGATALYPVYAAFAEAVYDENTFSQNDVLCTNTSNAYQAIVSGERDIIFVAGASQQQTAAAKASGVDLRFTPIGCEAFVFLVGNENPIDNITYQQLRNIYSGKTANWGTLGWRNGGRMVVFQRPEGSGSQTGLQKMIMNNLPIQVPQPLPDASLIGTNSLMKQVAVKWHGVQPAIGYSYRFYATTMYANPDAKLLKVNGIEPSIENIQNGSYPFVGNFYAVTNGEPNGNTKLFIDWILSPQGQEIIEKSGYTPLKQ
jgi:phosphate transport system substrate-binding protein